MNRLARLFGKHSDEFLKFDRVVNPQSRRPDLYAFLLLDKICPSNLDIISAAEHDEIFLSINTENLFLTEEQVIELHRSGVRYDEEYECLAMFV